MEKFGCVLIFLACDASYNFDNDTHGCIQLLHRISTERILVTFSGLYWNGTKRQGCEKEYL